jgi:hypothetical protein
MNVELLGMKFATGENATCIMEHPMGLLEVGKAYEILGNAGVDSDNPGITQYVILRFSDLLNQEKIRTEKPDAIVEFYSKGKDVTAVAINTKYFEPDETPEFVIITDSEDDL